MLPVACTVKLASSTYYLVHGTRQLICAAAVSPPPSQVSWWRVVLDEAQLVGGGFSSTAVMAARLTAQHRYAGEQEVKEGSVKI